MTEVTYQALLRQLDIYKGERAKAQLAMGEAAGRESDWHDNAAYDQANLDFNLANANIMNTQAALERVSFIQPRLETSDVQMGNTVQIQFFDEKEIGEYTLLGPADSSQRDDWLSYLSPIGQSLLGKKVGDVVHFTSDSKHQVEITVKGVLPGKFSGSLSK